MDKNMQVKIDILPVIFGLKRKEYLFIMTILSEIRFVLFVCRL